MDAVRSEIPIHHPAPQTNSTPLKRPAKHQHLLISICCSIHGNIKARRSPRAHTLMVKSRVFRMPILTCGTNFERKFYGPDPGKAAEKGTLEQRKFLEHPNPSTHFKNAPNSTESTQTRQVPEDVTIQEHRIRRNTKSMHISGLAEQNHPLRNRRLI